MSSTPLHRYGTSTFFQPTQDGMSRADAAQFCVDNGGELAIIRSVAEQNDATTACGAHTCWIGLAEIGGDALTDTVRGTRRTGGALCSTAVSSASLRRPPT